MMLKDLNLADRLMERFKSSRVIRNSSESVKQVLNTDQWIETEVHKLCRASRFNKPNTDSLARLVDEINTGKNRHFRFSDSAAKWTKRAIDSLALKICNGK